MYLYAGEITDAQPAECRPVQGRKRQHERNGSVLPQITFCTARPEQGRQVLVCREPTADP
jgi:hypothetical protein